MTKKTKMYLGGGLLAALAVGGIYYAMKKPATPAAPVNLLPGQVSTLTSGQGYTITALLPAGIADAASLAAALKAAGWSNVSVWAIAPPGANLATIPNIAAPTGGYVAQGTWTGTTGPVPSGIVAVAGLQTTVLVPLATA